MFQGVKIPDYEALATNVADLSSRSYQKFHRSATHGALCLGAVSMLSSTWISPCLSLTATVTCGFYLPPHVPNENAVYSDGNEEEITKRVIG